ncbi:unnamed protein product, partial [marine sediment metagenome]
NRREVYVEEKRNLQMAANQQDKNNKTTTNLPTFTILEIEEEFHS